MLDYSRLLCSPDKDDGRTSEVPAEPTCLSGHISAEARAAGTATRAKPTANQKGRQDVVIIWLLFQYVANLSSNQYAFAVASRSGWDYGLFKALSACLKIGALGQ